MRGTNRLKLYDYCKRYVRTIETRQDIIFLDPQSDLTVMNKINSKLKHLEKNIQTVINDDGDSV